jgi:predicted Zn-dependent protease
MSNRIFAPIVSLDRRHFLAGAASLLVSGCVVDQQKLVTSAVQMAQGMSFGEPDEIALGTKNYGALVDESGGPYRNSSVQRAVQRIADPMIRSSRRSNLPWEVTVLDDPSINAWAMPGGKLGINRGLLRYSRNEDELAAVLAHEIGHIENAHAAQTIRSQAFLDGMGTIGQDLVKSNTRGVGGALTDSAITALRAPVAKLITTGYSRDHEYEADANILAVFNRVGYEPKRSSGMFKTLLQVIPDSNTATNSLFSTHPGTRDRIAKLDQAASTLPAAPTRPASPDFDTIKRAFPTPQAV